MTTERGQWTSASSAAADRLCPGRHRAQMGLPELPESEAAAMGTLIHKHIAAGTMPEDKDAAEMVRECYECRCESLNRALGPGAVTRIANPLRLWVEFGHIRHSGVPDEIFTQGSHALVIDYKTGFGLVEESESNEQLRDYAVLVWLNYPGIQTVDVAVIQPRKTRTPTITRYGLLELDRALTEMRDRVVASNAPHAPLVAGEIQCRYCRAKGVCREFARSVAIVPGETTAEQLMVGIVALDGDKLGKFYALAKMAADAASDELRARLTRGESCEGWTLKPGYDVEEITDPQGVFENCASLGVSQADFMRAVHVTKTGLKQFLDKDQIHKVTRGCVKTKQTNPRLTKV